ncbi:hypothetical protein [Myxococcus qinghaiensis]|uniref:hypothetical protein n=1 Tax=Myxococcus qinghaiensis TaxID=2906758 RepID=UPI0020A790C2|nr:hypothetical protein [Myxococcus qinghaiensis]MCP3166605.1 hypothetical protein [Myxococcus qinghaiensis]
MKTLFIRSQAGRVLVMSSYSRQWGELTEVWPGEDFHGVTYAELRRLGDGRHEVEFNPSVSSHSGPGPHVVSIADQIGAIEFECDLGLLSKDLAAREVAVLCLSNEVGAVLAGASAEMRERVCLFAREANEAPGDEDDVYIGRPDLPRSVIRAIVAVCGATQGV